MPHTKAAIDDYPEVAISYVYCEGGGSGDDGDDVMRRAGQLGKVRRRGRPPSWRARRCTAVGTRRYN